MGTYALLAIKLAWSRLRARPGFAALSLLGVSITLGLIVSIPVFAELAARQVLLEELEGAAGSTGRALFSLRYYSLPTADWPMSAVQADQLEAWLRQLTEREIGLPVAHRYHQVDSPAVRFVPRGSESEPAGYGTPFNVAFVPGAEDHLEVTQGEPFQVSPDDSHLAVWVQERLAAQLGLNVGDTHHLSYSASGLRSMIPIRIAGVWRPKESSSGFWYSDPEQSLRFHFLTTQLAYRRFVEPAVEEGIGFAFWYYVLDDNRIELDRVDGYARGLERVRLVAGARLPRPGLDLSPLEPLQTAHRRKTMLVTMLYGLSLPVITLLYLSLALISVAGARQQLAETAVLASRGASRLHLLSIALAEGAVLAGVGLPLGLGTGYFLSRLAGQCRGFLAFSHRALPEGGLRGLDRGVLAAAVGLIIVAHVASAWAAGTIGVAEHGRRRSRPPASPRWLRAGLLALLIPAAAYAWWELDQRGTLGMLSWDASGSPLHEPLVFLAPTLFFLAGAVLLAGVFPLLARLGDAVVARFLSLPGYVGLRSLGREGGHYAGSLLLVVLCLAVGSFQASLAASADLWFVERLEYRSGSDLTFLPLAREDGQPVTLPLSAYLEIPGVEDGTRVGEFRAEYSAPGVPGRIALQMLAVERLGFQRVVHWRPDYAPESLGALMNQLALHSDGILVPSSFLAQTGLSLGDTTRLETSFGYLRRQLEFTIVGVFDHFPTMLPGWPPVVVTNLEYLERTVGGELIWHAWLTLAPGMDADRLRPALVERGVVPGSVRDLGGMLARSQGSLERAAVYGVLSLGFMAAGALAIAGLLLHVWESLATRVQRFAMMRAIGFSAGQLVATSAVEFLAVVVYGTAGGATLGVAASLVFVPYFQLTEDASAPVPPFVPRVAWLDIGAVGAASALVLGAAVAALMYLNFRQQVSQTLRLGDQG